MDEMDRPFPPGPKGPEELEVPGPRVTLSRRQAQAVAELAADCSAVEVEERGAAYLNVKRFDDNKGHEPFDERLIFPDGGYGTDGLEHPGG